MSKDQALALYCQWLINTGVDSNAQVIVDSDGRDVVAYTDPEFGECRVYEDEALETMTTIGGYHD